MDKTNNAIVGYLAGTMAGVLSGCIVGWLAILAKQESIMEGAAQDQWFSVVTIIWFVGLIAGWIVGSLNDMRLRIAGAGWVAGWIVSAVANIFAYYLFESIFTDYPGWACGWFIGCIVGAISGWYAGALTKLNLGDN
jgi:hypothetical protein